MRTKGSCRFKPYYKVQVRNSFWAWQSQKKHYDYPQEAERDFPKGKFCRIVEVSELSQHKPIL